MQERESKYEHWMKCMCGGMQTSLYIHCVYYTVYKDYDENIQCILYTRRRENDAQKKRCISGLYKNSRITELNYE